DLPRGNEPERSERRAATDQGRGRADRGQPRADLGRRTDHRRGAGEPADRLAGRAGHEPLRLDPNHEPLRVDQDAGPLRLDPDADAVSPRIMTAHSLSPGGAIAPDPRYGPYSRRCDACETGSRGSVTFRSRRSWSASG